MLALHYINQHNEEMNIVRELFREYGTGLDEDLCFQSFDDELQNPLKKYGEPKGCIVLAYWNNAPAGCVALQPLQQDVCEMKRLFVRAEYRKHGIGDELVKIIIEEGIKRGYKKMVLDTLERLQPAIRRYTRYGFVNTSAYYENPLPDVVYMEKTL